MPFQPGQSGNPSGRATGSKNKISVAAKQAFQEAFDEIGGVDTLKTWASENPTDFFKLFSKLIPVTADVTMRKPEEALKDLA